MAAQRSPRPITNPDASIVHTGAVSNAATSPHAVVTYGVDQANERQLHLLGDVPEGARVVELGISQWFNALALAAGGARAIAVDPDPGRIDEMRRRATVAEVTVQCFLAELADLGDVTSSSCHAVVAAHTLLDVDDLSRVLRQVHRILQPGISFVIAVDHPFATSTPARPYGSSDRTFGEWLTALTRTNFRVDQLLELGVGADRPIPATLVIRSRKEGN
jgi:ubiquinone/menaquinone biosynthesis C-methylase UbiE